MSLQVLLAPPILWVMGCFALLLWLWVLCTACPRKQVQRPQAALQGSVRPIEAVSATCPQGRGSSRALGVPTSLPAHLCTLSKSDTRLHELHRGPRVSALQPASMDLPHAHWPERLPAAPFAFPHQEPPQSWPAAAVASIGPEATYSNVGLAALPRASLAASPVVWAGAWLAGNCVRPGPGIGSAMPEYACIRKPKGTVRGPQTPHQGKVEGTPASQVDILYSRVSKPQRRDPGAATLQQDPVGDRAILAPGSDWGPAALSARGLSVTNAPLENVYESILELGGPRHPSSGY